MWRISLHFPLYNLQHTYRQLPVQMERRMARLLAQVLLLAHLAALLVESAGRTVVLVDPLLPTDRQRLQLQWRLLQPELTLLSLAQSPPIPASSNASTLLEAQLSWRADLETQLFLPTPLQAPEHIRQVLVMPPQVKPAAPGV